MLATMADAVRQFQIIDSALVHVSRHRTDEVVAAYSRIVNMEETERGRPLEPREHVEWIHGISRGVGVHVVDRVRLPSLLELVHNSCPIPDPSFEDDVSLMEFDPRHHIVVTTQPTVLSYFSENDFPTGGRTEMGGARIASSNFSYSVMWWDTS